MVAEKITMKLGVNVDHVATLRQARGTLYPDPTRAALLCEYAGCDSIVMHLREDRRHIQGRDVVLAKKALAIPFNLEMSINKGIVDFALKKNQIASLIGFYQIPNIKPPLILKFTNKLYLLFNKCCE